MEEYQKEKINQYLRHLIQRTTCSAPFLAEFQQKGVLSNSDVVTLEVEGNNRGCLQQSKKFYEIIQTRIGSYEILLEALENASQNGALALLKNNETEPGKKASKTISYTSPPKYLPDFLRGSISTLVIHTPDCEISRSRIIETVPNVIEYSPMSFATSIPTTSSKPSSSQQELPLINCQHGIDHLKYSLKDTKKKIILLPDNFSDEIHELQVRLQCKKVQHENDELEWDDLHPRMQISVEENLKSFQLSVNCEVTLSKLKGKVLFELIKGNQPTLFKNTIPPRINYYIPRRLITRNIISKEVLHTGGIDLFLIKGIKRHELTEIANGQETDTSSNLIEKKDLGSIKVALLDCDSDYDIIVGRVGSERFVHVFEYHEDKLTWVKSSGSIYSIQGAVDSSQNTLTEDEFLENIVNSQTTKSDPVCISDSPGMGKSVLLASIGQKLQENSKDFWNVGFVVISELVENTKKLAHNTELKEQVTSFLTSTFCENELGVAYFQSHTNELTNLLLDGLDELQAEVEEFGYELLKLLKEMLPNTRIWVTTRPHIFLNLEAHLNVLGYNILAFEEQDQVRFLKLYWTLMKTEPNTELYKVEVFAQKCLISIKSQINSSREHDIAGIPLQCLLIGEVFEDDALRYATTTDTHIPTFVIKSVADLYEQTVKKKFDNYYTRYDKDKYGHADLTNEHSCYSLWLLFPKVFGKFEKKFCSNPLPRRQVLNVGILESKTVVFSPPRFIHRTFAEYFVAKFVVDALSNPSNLTANLFNLLYKNILKTKRVAQQKFGKAKVSTRHFVHNVVCYFIDSLISKAGGVKCKDELSSKCSSLKLAEWKQLCEGCACSSFEHIFQHLVYELPVFAQFEKGIFTEEFLVICTLFSDANMAITVYEAFVCVRDKDLSKIEWQGYSLMQLAVIRGNYKLFEKNSSMIQQISLQDGEFYWSLVLDCVAESKSNNSHIIKEKIEILNYLLRLIDNSQFSLKFQKYDNFLSSNSNIDLAIKLVECTDVTDEGTKQLIYKATGWYNCKDFQRLLKSLAVKIGSRIDKILCNKKFKLVVIKNMDLNPEFLQILKDLGSTLNVLDMLNDEKLFLINDSKRQTDIRTSNLRKLLDSEHRHLDMNGNTLLHKMCTSTKNIVERLDLIQNLIDKGTDLNSKNNNLETPFDILSKQDFTKEGLEMMNLIESSCGNVNENFFLKINWILKDIEEMKFTDYADICSKVTATQPIRDNEGNTLLHLVAKLNDYLAIEHLLSLDVEVNALNMRKESPLHVAIQHNTISLQDWKLWIDNGADPSSRNIDNETVIFILIDASKYDLIEYVLNHALLVHSPMLEKVFHLVIWYGNPKDTENLFSWFTKSVDTFSFKKVLNFLITKTEDDGNTLLHKMCMTATDISERLKIIQHLIDNGADLNAKNNNLETPFNVLTREIATREGLQMMNLMESSYGNIKGNFFLKINWIVRDIEDMKFSDYADVCSKVTATQPITDKYGNTLLHLVAKLNDYLAIEHLLSLGVDVNAQNTRNETSLHVAIQNDQISLQSWKVWIDNGADPCLSDMDNKTPIHKLYRSDKKLELIEYSMNHALRVQSPMLKKIFLLALSCWKSENIKKLCVWFTDNVNASLSGIQGNFKGRRATVLDAALYNTEDGNVLEYIVETQKCQTALLPFGYVWFYKSLTEWDMHYETKFLEVVNKLFPDLINTPDENGIHPLYTKGIDSDAARTLIRLGSNVNHVDKFGHSPLHWALKHIGSGHLVDELVKGGADVNAVTKNGETPLQLSLKTDLSFFITLVEHDADLRRDFSFDNTILHQVVKNVWTRSLPDVMDVLLKKGYQDLLQFSDMNNQTPIQIAQQRYENSSYRDDNLIKVFREYGIHI